MNSDDNNEELHPPDNQTGDEPAVNETDCDETSADVTRGESTRVDEPTGPGQLLSRKREALGMSIQQVADELHITMHYVRSLECNAHDKLPGDVFIRGYIRAYANLLKLDPVVLINVYNEFTNQQATAAEEATSGRSRRRRDKNMPWIIVSGIAFVGIAFALWYFNTRPAPTATGSTQGASSPVSAQVVVPAPSLRDGSTPTIVNVSTTLAAAIVAPGNEVAQALDAPVAGAAAPDGILQQTAVGATDLQTSALETNAGEANPVETNSAKAMVGQPNPTPTTAPVGNREPVVPSDNDAEQQLPIATRVISVDAGGEDLVQITFKGESIVQVEDSSDQQIYRDIRTSGDVLRITGSAPFNILLGDAAVTELSLNGNNIDFTSNIRIDNSVRLTIGL